jgi:hypothetical protein
MRNAGFQVAVLGLLLVGGPARAAGPVFTLGSYLGLDSYGQDGHSLTALSTSPVSPYLFPVEPGLRVGMVLPGERVELAAMVGATLFASEGETMSSLGCTLDGNFAFAGDEQVRPYAGLHVGLSNLGEFGSSSQMTNVGAQIGVRRMVSAGHGALRLELRGSMIGLGEGESMSDLGLRLGYDLWFR